LTDTIVSKFWYADVFPGNQHLHCCNSRAHNLKLTKAQRAYLRDDHLVTYEDIVMWSGNRWCGVFRIYHRPPSRRYTTRSPIRSTFPYHFFLDKPASDSVGPDLLQSDHRDPVRLPVSNAPRIRGRHPVPSQDPPPYGNIFLPP